MDAVFLSLSINVALFDQFIPDLSTLIGPMFVMKMVFTFGI
jgi:hypothetical protein